jgi:hypothetical protein
MRLHSTHPAIPRDALGRRGPTTRSELRNDPRLLHTSWPDLFRPSTPCCGCRPGVDTRHAPGMTASGLDVRASRYFRFNCQTATALQTCVIAPIVCGAGAPSSAAFLAPVRGRAERQVPVAPLGLMRCGLPQSSVHQDFRRRRASARRSACGVFSVACTLPRRTLRSRIKVPRRWEGSLKRLGRTRFELVVRHTVQGSVHPKVGRVLASGSAGADPSCPKTDVPP